MVDSERLREDLASFVDISPVHLVIEGECIDVCKFDEKLRLSAEEAELLVYLLQKELKRRSH